MIFKPKKVLEKAFEEGEALTFDDVRLRTGYSEIAPNETDTKSKFSRNIELNIPIVSAAMDSVTEYSMAIELAKLGGIGVIHKNMSLEEQCFQIRRVKHTVNLEGPVRKPICVTEDRTIESILNEIENNKYSFNTFPVINKEGKLSGIITGNDFSFCDNLSSQAKEIMSTDPITVLLGTDINKAYSIMKENKKKVLPIVDNEGKVEGMYTFNDINNIRTGVASNYNVDDRGQLRVAAAIGTGEESLKRAEELAKKHVDALVIDTAHGDSINVIKTLEEIKKQNYSLDVVVGNISVGDSVKRLADLGADGIKVGQGPGSICTTRIIAGIGRPQVSAIYDCAKAIHEGGYDIALCADGGLKNSGDIPIAIAAYADSVMMGSMLAGTDESPGEIVFNNNMLWKAYRGMGSLAAMEKHDGSRERYRQEDSGKNNLVPEGIEGLVKYKGKLSDMIIQYVGGLQKGMGYVGAANISELMEKGDFDRITNAGYVESHPHGINITQGSPNYQ